MACGTRGQGALEYMANYGWMILVVGVVGYAAWNFGFLGVGESSSTGAKGFQDVKVLHYRLFTCPLGGSDVLRLECQLVNSEPGNIQFTGVSVCQEETMCSESWYMESASGNTTDICDGLEVSYCGPGISCPATPSGDTVTLFAPVETGGTPPTLGEPVTLDVIISYEDLKSGLSHQSRGAIWGPVEDHT